MEYLATIQNRVLARLLFLNGFGVGIGDHTLSGAGLAK
jgi:hypothetical protein